MGDAPKARQAARRAQQLDPSLAEAHAALGNVSLFYDYDGAVAEKEFREAIRLNPSYATARQWHSYSLVAQGRFDEAIAEIAKARSVDPLSLSIATDAADIRYYSRRFDEAEQECRKAIELDPNFVQAHLVLGHILELKNDLAGAIREFESIHRGADLAQAYALSGRDREAREIFEKLSDEEASPFMRAQVLAGLGEKKLALDYLERAYAKRDGILILLGVDPQFDSLRSDLRFQDLLRRVRSRGIPGNT